MKKRKLIGLASLMLALGVMAGCGDNPDDPKPDPGEQPTECQHEYKFVSVDESKHQEVCEKCGAVKEKSQKNHSFKKDPAKEAENKEATCTDAGWEWQICDKCGATKKKDIAAKGHSFTVVKSTTATCTAAGENTMECSRCGAESPEKQAAEALGHNMVADDSYTEGLAASCTGGGTAREKCTRCTYTEIVPTAPLGHDYNEVAGTDVDGFATLTSGTCKRSACDGKKVYWSALQVTDNCKNNKRVVPAAEEGGEDFTEPNYVEEGDGVRFWGRPIHNACVLQENGKPESQSAATPVYDENVTGSFFEYKINLAEAMTDVKLVADMAVTVDLGSGELYKATSGDWTPGLHDSTSNKYAVRYAIFVTTGENTVEIALDADGSYTCPGTERQWYTFPSDAFTLAAGEHTIRIAMAGGYLSTYYAFGFEKVVGAIHEHAYTNDPDNLSKAATCTEDGRQYGVCSCGLVEDKVLPKLGHDLQDAESDVNVAATCLVGGKQHKECSRCEYFEDVDIAPLGHDFVADGEPMVNEGFATVNPQKCSRDDVERYVIDAKDVSDATKNDKRLVSAAVEADPDNGVEAQDAVYEPNYTENNDGSVKFYGRPIHNAMNLPATQNDHTSVYDENVAGSFIEYKFKVPAAIEDVKLVAEIKPANYMRQNNVPMFSNPASISDDWTPGLSADGEMYPTRYIISLNGTVLEQDLTNDKVAASDNRAWYAFPLKDQLDFAAGDYTLRITMAGGYECSFYNIGIQTQDPESELPPEPVDEGITLNVSSATGYTNKADKMKSNAVFTLGEGEGKVAVEPGEYSVEIMAKMSSGSHSNRKWYNMAKPELCVDGTKEETATSSPDTADQDDFRYFMMVDNVVYNPESKDSWGTIGLDANNYNKVAFVSKIIVSEVSKTITIAHGDIGYSLYVEGIKLTKIGDHTHDVAVGDAVGTSNMKTFGCACGFGGYEMSALASTDFVSGMVPTSDKNTRLGKGGVTADVWNIAGIEAGTYNVYLKAKTQGGNESAYWNAGDSVANGDSSSNNGGAAANDVAYRYKIAVGEGDPVNVGLASTTYATTGLGSTAEAWTNVSVATIEVAEGATTITLSNMNNGYAIWVYGLRLVRA